MNEKNAASEPGERSCLSRTGVILEIEEREYRRRINRRSNCDGKYFYPIG